MPYKNSSAENEIAELIQACRKDDVEAQEALYKHYYAYAMGVSLRYAYSRSDAISIVNDSFLKVFENINSYNSKQSFKSWFRRILINTAIDKYRKERKWNEQTEPISVPDMPGDFEDAISKLTVEDIMEMLNHLSEEQRLVFNLSEIEGYSHKEIGEKLNIKASSSRSSLSRAKAKLRELFLIKFDDNYE